MDLAGLIVTVTFALFGAVVTYFEKARAEERRRADEARAEDRRRADEALAEDRRTLDTLARDVRHSMRRMDSHASAASRVKLLGLIHLARGRWCSRSRLPPHGRRPHPLASPMPLTPGAAAGGAHASAADSRTL